MKYTVAEIASITKSLPGSILRVEQTVSILLTDSRSLAVPDVSLFFALKTNRNDGHNYIQFLYNKGVRAFVVAQIPEDNKYEDASFIVVNDVLKALQRIASHYRRKFTVPIIGITGSNGKTIVKEWLYRLLHADYHITRSPRSYNSQIGVPLSLSRLNDQTELGIFEAGISEMNEMSRLARMIMPTIGIFTNLGEAHQEGFESLQAKCDEKLKLFSMGCELIIYDADNPIVSQCVKKSCFGVSEIAWSKENTESPLYISKITQNCDSTDISYSYIGIKDSFTIPFFDEASIENAIHCLAVMLYLHVSAETIRERMAELEPIAMRMEVKEGINGCVIINDSYTTDIHSLDVALDFLSRRASVNNSKKTIILSDILQSGMLPNALYKRVADLLKSYRVDRLVGIGKNLSAHTSLFDMEKEFYPSTEVFLQSNRIDSFSNEVVLLKGSRRFHLEDISEHIERRVHETILEVNLDALIHNLNFYKSKLKPSTKVVCMVKAFGYGVGSVEICKTLQEHGCDYLAVATADEGMELRKSGVHIPIIVMNPEFGSLHTLFNYSLEPEVYSFKLLNDMLQVAGRHGLTNYPIHLKINSGMNRLGFQKENIPELIEKLKRQTVLSVSSIFSHLIASDVPLHDDITRQQIALFDECTNRIKEELNYPILCHILNTAGIVRFAEEQREMVRLGIGLYGVVTAGEEDLKNVATLKTNILQIQHIADDSYVGYGGNNKVKKGSMVAVIPIGYADGLSRRLSNGVGEVSVNGYIVPIIGTICMDITMIDVTGVPNVKEGDTVTVYGGGISIISVAQKLGTIPYEVLTSVSARVKRVYLKE